MYADLALGLIFTLLGIVLKLAIDSVRQKWRERKGKLTGSWIGVIPVTDGEDEKLHCLELSHVGPVVTGSIERPIQQSEGSDRKARKWQLHGRLHGDTLVAIFWGASDGVMLLKQERSADVFKGQYLSLDESVLPNGEITGRLKAISVIMNRP